MEMLFCWYSFDEMSLNFLNFWTSNYGPLTVIKAWSSEASGAGEALRADVSPDKDAALSDRQQLSALMRWGSVMCSASRPPCVYLHIEPQLCPGKTGIQVLRVKVHR